MRRLTVFFICVFSFIMLVLEADPQDQIVTIPSSSQIFVGTNVRFIWESTNQMSNYSYSWQIQGESPIPGNTASVSYVFKDPRKYVIKCSRSDSTTLEIQINVRENRSIELPPKFIDIFEGATILLETRKFNASRLKWDLGDGTITWGGHRFSHTYRRSGIYTIKVYDFEGQSKIPVEKQVRVERDNREIQLPQQTIFENTKIEIKAVNFGGRTIQWNFGDSFMELGGPVVEHIYQKSGSFTIKAVDFGGRDGKTIEKSIQVMADNRIFDIQDEIIAGESIDIQIRGIVDGNLIWKFPDGEQRSGNIVRGKTFKTPGPVDITVEDQSGKYPPMVKQIMVHLDRRRLQASPLLVIPGEIVQFEAINFSGPVRWDFGDGTVKERGREVERHGFANVGNYKVQAVDFNGQSQKAFAQQITVQDLSPDFRVQTIELTFTNGKYYQVVGRKSLPPRYRAKLKAKGRGILKGKWLLDGMTLGVFEVILRDRETALLKGGNLVKIPVIDHGLHNLTFTFTNYSYNGKIPRLRYFVTNTNVIQILNPLPGTKLPHTKSLDLRWLGNKSGARYDVAISEIPFQFLTDDQILWKSVGNNMEYNLDLSSYKASAWIYWYVREVGSNGRVITTSEIGSFKMINN